jgi:hypothetical protein
MFNDVWADNPPSIFVIFKLIFVVKKKISNFLENYVVKMLIFQDFRL